MKQEYALTVDAKWIVGMSSEMEKNISVQTIVCTPGIQNKNMTSCDNAMKVTGQSFINIRKDHKHEQSNFMWKTYKRPGS